MDTPQPARPIAPQLVMGLLIVVVGLLFTLENVGLIDGHDYLRYWPVALIAVGMLKLWQGSGSAVFGGFVFVFVGVWLLLQAMGIVTVSLWNLWPMLLVFAGASMVWRGLYGGSVERATADAYSTVSAMAVLAGVNRRNTSKTFRGGDLTAVFGGCQIDLRQAAIEAGKYCIDLAREGMTGANPAVHKTIEGFGVNIVKLTPQERAAFVKVTRPTYEKWAKQIGPDLVKKAEAAVAARKQ